MKIPQLPTMASNAVDELPTGARLYEANGIRRAIILDGVGSSPTWIAAVYDPDKVPDDIVGTVEDQFEAWKKYVTIELLDLDDWIAVDLGKDEPFFIE